jgi:drug/metabolite transporter (DMT)-like permease
MATRNSSSWTSINSADRSSVSGTERTERSDRTDRTDRTSLWTSLTSITSVESSIAPHLLLIVSQFLYSGWHIIGFLALKNGANPLVLALYRGSFASVLMFFFALTQTKGNHKLFKIDPNDYLRFVFLGFCSFVSVVGTIISFQYITPSHYAIFQPLVPCMATIISCSINLEKCTTLKVIGISVAALGAIIIESGAVVMKVLK